MEEIKIGRMVLGMYQTNCYFIYRSGSPEAIVIDPADQGERIADALEKNGFRTAAILITHGHFDHIWGCQALKEAADKKAAERGFDPVKVYACEGEKELLTDPHMNVSQQMGRPCTLRADVYVTDGQTLTLAGMTCRVLATPGHTSGGCCYYFEEGGFVVCGDTLFLESVGRSDFPTGSTGELIRSIQDKLFPLPEDTVVYPGHGDSTTVGHEKKYNPFCV